MMRYNGYLGFAAGSGRGIDRIPRLLTLTLPPNNQNITEELAIVSLLFLLKFIVGNVR